MRPFAWLSLDGGDNDPIRFLSYLIAALQTVDLTIGAATQALLQAPQPPMLESVLTPLLNDIHALAKPLVLVLDDYHVIMSEAIDKAIIFVLDNLPPTLLHVVLTTRSTPAFSLSRWRVRREITEIRAHDLRFTHVEATAFLQQTLNLDLQPADITALEERTEGWVAALQLASLSLAGRDDVHGFIQAFTGSDAYIVDYLVEEVLQRQSTTVEQFLLQTSILAQLSAPLCNAVTGHSDGQAMLEQLERANLFLIPLDNERRWYRYHHLFAELLRSRLDQAQPAQTIELHQRASVWYAQQGRVVEAMHHARAARNDAWAAHLLEESGESLIKRGEFVTLQGWLEELPPALVAASPRLSLLYAMSLIIVHQLDGADRTLQDARQAAQAMMEGQRLAEMLAEIAAVEVSIALNRRELPRAIELVQRALADLPESKLQLRGRITMQLGLAYNWSGASQRAYQVYGDASQISLRAGDIYTAVLSTSNQAGVLAEWGKLRQAAAMEQRAIDLAAEHGAAQMPVLGAVQAQLAEYLYEWNDLERAKQHLTEAIERIERAHNPRLLLLSHVNMARTLWAQGDSVGGRIHLTRTEQLVSEHTLPLPYSSKVAVCQVRFWLAEANLAAAQDWMQQRKLAVDDEPAALATGAGVLYRLLARLLIATGEDAEALRLLARLLPLAESAQSLAHHIEILALQAIAHAAQGDRTRAFAALHNALILAEPEGYIRTFVDEGASLQKLLVDFRPHLTNLPLRAYTDQLLAAFAIPTARATPIWDWPVDPPITEIQNLKSKIQNLIEPLTERELEVLHLVAAGLSDRQIAAQLVVVLGTVKRHLNNLYGKLGVHRRTQAILRAKELGLL